MTEPIATVVIPALNAAAQIGATLDALDAQTIRHSLYVIVIDNGSTDRTLEIAKLRADEVAVVTGGCAAARNAGLARTLTPFMLSLDSDCVPVSGDWAEHHLRVLTGEINSVVATAGRALPRPGSDSWAARADVTPHPAFEDGRPLYAVTGNACFRTETLRSLGGFPLIAADDAGLGIRARRAGYSFRWTPEALVYHANAPGWRGYLRQMRKVGRYSVEIHGAPASAARFYASRLRYLPSALGRASRGQWHEAAATGLAALGQTLGARETWRRGLPAGEAAWRLPPA